MEAKIFTNIGKLRFKWTETDIFVCTEFPLILREISSCWSSSGPLTSEPLEWKLFDLDSNDDKQTQTFHRQKILAKWPYNGTMFSIENDYSMR